MTMGIIVRVETTLWEEEVGGSREMRDGGRKRGREGETEWVIHGGERKQRV